jgi:hypothetical protein
MTKIDRLFVIWGAPSDGGRHVIGHLERDRAAGAFRFWYEPSLESAMSRGFTLLPVFPDHRTAADPYVARYLFATFADRIPSPHRADGPPMLTVWGVEDRDDQFEILAKSGGVRATDRMELAEFRSIDDDLRVPLEFRVAGAKYVAEDRRASLLPGAVLRLEREPTNPHDPFATIVATTSDGKRAGYVPRQYSAMISKLIETGVEISVTAMRELLLPDDAGRWVVRAVRNG